MHHTITPHNTLRHLMLKATHPPTEPPLVLPPPLWVSADYQAQGSYRQEGPVERVDSGDSALQGSTFTNISGFSKLTVESMRERVRSSNSSMVGDNAQAAPPNAQLVSGLASLQERFRRLQEDKSRPGSAAAGGEQGLD
jgi:hypothetical protein